MPSAAAQDVLQAILEQRAAEKRREMAAPPAGPPAALPFANRIAGAFDAAEPVRQVDELSAPITLPFAARNQLGDWHGRMPNVVKAIADPRTNPFGPAAVARLFMDPAGEVGRQVETGQELARPFTQFNDPNVDPVKQAADLALTAMGGSSVVPEEANSLRMGIKAYHASPHDFERFDYKPRTGEGGMAFGPGTYVAEHPGVSGRGGSYDRLFTRRNLGQEDTTPQQEYILNQLGEGASDLDILKGLAQRGGTDFEQAQGMLDKIKAAKAKIYEMDINADPEQFLDWDKPLSEQPHKWTPEILEAVRKEANDRAMSATTQARRDELFDMVKDPTKAPGEFVAEAMGLRRGAKTEEVATTLRDAGIPGIRYLDQGSRTKGTVVAGDGKPTGYHNIDSMIANTYGTWEQFKAANPNPSGQLKAAIDELDARGGVKFNRDEGTHNFVIFPGNEHLIAVLKKYGLPISAAGLAALSQLHPQEAQAAQKQRQ